MVWSTQQLADVAGTTRRAVRHYHDQGLLPEPDRRANGYRRYGVDHLVRLLRIRRLVDLGLPLAQIAGIGDADLPPAHTLRTLEADLTESIARLEEQRAEVVAMLGEMGAADVPSSMRATEQPATDRALATVMGHLLEPTGLEAYGILVDAAEHDSTAIELESMAVDAEEAVRADVATRLADHMGRVADSHPDQLRVLDAELGRGPRPKQLTVDLVLADLFNEAQLDVLHRSARLNGRRRSSAGGLTAGARRAGTVPELG